MKTNIKKILALLLCLIIIGSIGSLSIVNAVDEQAVPFSDKSYENFCEIKRTNDISDIYPLKKLELYANYRAYSDKHYELVWTIDGKSVFIDGDSDKTAKGNEVELLFLGDTTVKLQIILSNGDVLCEDEMLLETAFPESSGSNDMSFGDRIVSWIWLAMILFVGIIGGTVGPFIGKLM